MEITDKSTLFEGWLRNFKECHVIRKLDISDEMLSADNDTAEQYNELFHYLAKQHTFLPTQIYDDNQT
jgi:hypothetical protein